MPQRTMRPSIARERTIGLASVAPSAAWTSIYITHQRQKSP